MAAGHGSSSTAVPLSPTVSALHPPAPPQAAAVTVMNVSSAAAAPPASAPSIKGRRDFYPVLVAGACVTAIAGFINATFMISSYNRAVSHMTGTTTRVGTSLFGHQINYFDVVQCLISIGSFVAGSIVCGIIIGSEREFKRVRAYGVAMVVQSLVLYVAAFIPPINGYELPVFFGSFACGLQNGLVSTFSSAIIRTTHVTGLLTDIGVLIGQGLRWWIGRGPPQKGIWKLKIFIPLYVAFMLGCMIGTLTAMKFEIYALLFPASMLLLAGLSHIVFRTMALDTVKRKGMKVEVLDADSQENPGYFAALESHSRELRRAHMVEAGLRRVDTTMGLLDDMNMVDFMAETPQAKSRMKRMSSTMGILQPAYYAASPAASSATAGQPAGAGSSRATTTLAGMIDAGAGGASRAAKQPATAPPMLHIRIPGQAPSTAPVHPEQSEVAGPSGASTPALHVADQLPARPPSPPSPSPRPRPKGKDASARPSTRAYTPLEDASDDDDDDDDGGLIMGKPMAVPLTDNVDDHEESGLPPV